MASKALVGIVAIVAMVLVGMMVNAMTPGSPLSNSWGSQVQFHGTVAVQVIRNGTMLPTGSVSLETYIAYGALGISGVLVTYVGMYFYLKRQSSV